MIEKVKGFKDLYPEDYFLFSYVTTIIKKVAYSFGFQQYDTPILESIDLYKKKSGNEIMSQLFEFEDKGKRKVTLRPEMTPSLIRLVSQVVKSYSKPIKWFSINENFRYEKPQKGRLRSFYQFNFDILCEKSIISDLEIIKLLINCFKALGLSYKDFYIKISDRILWNYILELLLIKKNDINNILLYIDKSDKDNYESLLFFLKNNYKNNYIFIFNFIKEFILCDTIDKIIDFINKQNIFDHKKESINIRINYLKKLFNLLNLSNLNKYNIIDLKIVRGISYYNGIVFEVFNSDNTGRSICGGGRYNTFSLKDINDDIPAIGFAIGYIPLLNLLKNKKNLLPIYQNSSQIFFVINYEDENDIKEAFHLINEIRYIGHKIEYTLNEININKQIKKAYISNSKIIFLYEKNVIKIKDINNKTWKIINKNEIYNYINHLII